MGTMGQYTDAPHSRIPPTAVVRADNATFYNDCVEKDFGSMRWNQSAILPFGVVQGYDFWPDEHTQRVVTVLSDGSVYRFRNPASFDLVSALGTAPVKLKTTRYVTLAQAGAEDVNRQRKLFIFTGTDPVQVITGDGMTRANISRGASDWTGSSHPFKGISFRNFLFAFGNRNNPHGIYASSGGDHEDFTTTPLNFQVFPGEGEFLIDGFVFRNRLYVTKYPTGVYYLVDTDTDRTNWYFAKLSEDFGSGSPHSAINIPDDVLIQNNFGSVTSMKAALIFGDVTTSDLFHQVGIKNFSDGEVIKETANYVQALYYADRKRALFSWRNPGSSTPNRICNFDFKKENQPPRVSWSTKDQPNCLFTIKDSTKVPRACYGAFGYIYQLDSLNRWVGDTLGLTLQQSYAMDVRTPNMDLSSPQNPTDGTENKIFDFLEIEYLPSGKWDLLVDIFIDGKFSQTVAFDMSSGRSELDSFVLDHSTTAAECPLSTRKPIKGTGKKIQLRFYNSNAGENVQLVKASIYYKPSGQQQLKAGV